MLQALSGSHFQKQQNKSKHRFCLLLSMIDLWRSLWCIYSLCEFVLDGAVTAAIFTEDDEYLQILKACLTWHHINLSL